MKNRWLRITAIVFAVFLLVLIALPFLINVNSFRPEDRIRGEHRIRAKSNAWQSSSPSFRALSRRMPLRSRTIRFLANRYSSKPIP